MKIQRVYTNKEDAAKAVNLQCRELKIDLKNPSVQISENETLKTWKEEVMGNNLCPQNYEFLN